jgi:hypothetical protein
VSKAGADDGNDFKGSGSGMSFSTEESTSVVAVMEVRIYEPSVDAHMLAVISHYHVHGEGNGTLTKPICTRLMNMYYPMPI